MCNDIEYYCHMDYLAQTYCVRSASTHIQRSLWLRLFVEFVKCLCLGIAPLGYSAQMQQWRDYSLEFVIYWVPVGVNDGRSEYICQRCKRKVCFSDGFPPFCGVSCFKCTEQ